jgi:hypothetical protein
MTSYTTMQLFDGLREDATENVRLVRYSTLHPALPTRWSS